MIHRNTISRFKTKEKNTIKIENKNINNISNSNYFTLPDKTKILILFIILIILLCQILQ